jgi:hypothetical protein
MNKKLVSLNPRKVSFNLTVKTVRMPRPELYVPYSAVLRPYKEDGKKLLETVERLDKMFMAKSDIFSIVAEVKLVLESMEMERDEKGKKVKIEGKFQAKPFEIKSQRLINVILTPIYDAIDDWDEKNKGKHKDLQIQLAPKYAIYLCDRMIEQCSEYSYTGSFIVEMHDYFLQKKTEAEMVQKMIKSNASDEEIDKAVKTISIEDLIEDDDQEEK